MNPGRITDQSWFLAVAAIAEQWFAQPCTCRPGVNLPVEVEWHRPVPKFWAATSLSLILLLNIFIEEKDLPETSSLQRGLVRNIMCFQIRYKMYSLINFLSSLSLSEVSSREKIKVGRAWK